MKISREKTHGKIKLRIPNIRPSVRSLHDHLLALDRPTRESELVASAAGRTSTVDSGEAIGEIITDSPRRLVAAHVGRAASAARLSILVAEGFVVDVAGLDWGCDARFVAPGAAGFATIPGKGEWTLGLEGRLTYQ